MKTDNPKSKSSPLSRAAYKRGGAVKGNKGGATVNIIIPTGQAGPGPGAPPAMPLPAGPMPVPVRGPVPAGLAGGVPGPAVPAAPGPMAVPPGLAGAKPPMKRGGVVMAGAGTGLGRLQKAHHRSKCHAH